MEDKLKDLKDWFSRDVQLDILAYLSSRLISFDLEEIRERVCATFGLAKDNEQDKRRIDYNLFYLMDSGLVSNLKLMLSYEITAKGIDLLINDNGSYLGIKN